MHSGRAKFQHPLLAMVVIRTRRERGSWQAMEGLLFACKHTTGMDLLEPALCSITQVTQYLIPESPQLAALLAR